MRKRVLFTIIPKYFKNMSGEDNGVNIKVIYWKIND